MTMIDFLKQNSQVEFKSSLDQLTAFLKVHQKIWSSEVLTSYPDSLRNYPSDWIEYLNNFSEEELFQIDSNSDLTFMEDHPFKDYCQQIKLLSMVPTLPAYPNAQDTYSKIPTRAYTKVKDKKKHEISKIGPVVDQLNTSLNFNHCVDIGGGQGHLARVLSKYLSIPMITIDQNQEFQNLGKKRIKKDHVLDSEENLDFLNLTFGEDKLPKNTFTNHSFSLGLHTCGPLSLSHFKESIKAKSTGLLNFGCCYARLDSEKETGISKYAQENPVNLTHFALSLAARSNSRMSIDDFKFKVRVKKYRYAFHIFLFQRFGDQTFRKVGDSKPSSYWLDFSTYAEEKLEYLNLDIKFSKQELNDFFDKLDIQSRIRKMILANIIRWQLGRIIELYITYDRCLYLQEQGQRVYLSCYFKQEISPRNLGILALSDEKTV